MQVIPQNPRSVPGSKDQTSTEGAEVGMHILLAGGAAEDLGVLDDVVVVPPEPVAQCTRRDSPVFQAVVAVLGRKHKREATMNGNRVDQRGSEQRPTGRRRG